MRVPKVISMFLTNIHKPTVRKIVFLFGIGTMAYKHDVMSVAIVSVLCYHLYQIPTNNDTRYKFLKWSEIVRGSIYIGIDIFHGPGAELDPVP